MNVDDVETDSDEFVYENEAEWQESEARKKLRGAKAQGVGQNTPAKEQGSKRELDPVTVTKSMSKSPRTNAQPKPTLMAYTYNGRFPARGFKPVGVGVALKPKQCVLSITQTKHGEAPKVRHIGRKRDGSYTCAHAGENGMAIVGDACQSLFHAAIHGDVSHLRDGKDGIFYSFPNDSF